jgi:hypothetical protein
MSDIQDLIREAQNLTHSYRATADGHHSRLRMFLQETYALHLRFRDNAAAFRELRRDPFWAQSRQKPKPTTSRWLLLFVTRAASENDRSRVGKFAAVLDFFTEMKLSKNCVANAIGGIGGVDAAHQAALRMRRMRLVPPPDQSGERHGTDAETDLLGAKSDSPARAGVTFAEVASLELAGVDGTNESAVVTRLTKMLADPSTVGFEVKSPSKKRANPYSLDNAIVVEEVRHSDFDEIIGGATPISPVRRYVFVVDVLPRDLVTDLVPVKLIAIEREEAYVRSR